MRVFISAGEASGDALGAALLAALRARVPELTAFGMGGPRMKAAGFEARFDAREVGVVGFVEVVRHLPRLFRLKRALADLALADRPDVAILIDVPDFNIRLARHLRAANIPVVFYVGPSVWAWRAGRVHTFKRDIDRLLVLFPFEVDVWRSAGVDVVCVGHPLQDEIPEPARESPETSGTVALLPGSRVSEVERHLETLLAAARELLARGLARRFVLPVAPTLDREVLEGPIRRAELEGRVELVSSADGDPAPRRRAVAEASLALVASGTATLETALLGRPQVIFYRVNGLSFWIGKLFTRLRHLGLPNIIAGREVVPELLQGRFTPMALVEAASRILSDRAARARALEAAREVRARLGEAGAADRAAAAVLDLVARRASAQGLEARVEAAGPAG